MKKIKLLFSLLSVLSFQLHAQNSSLTFFSSQGEKFWVVLNGLRQNIDAQTNVKLEPFASGAYKAKIIFEDTLLGECDKNIELTAHTALTYSLKKKEETALGNKTTSLGHTISKDLNMKQPDKTEKPELYKLILFSQTSYGNSNSDVGNYSTPQQTTVVTQQTTTPTNTTVVVQQQQPTGTVVQQTTTTTTGYPNDNVNMSVGVGGVGMNMNVNVSDNTTITQQTTTTTVGGYPQQTTVVYVPGYSGPIGCPVPMNPNDYAAAKNSIASKSFEDSKLTIAKQIIGSNCITSDQVKEIMQLFSFEATKLDFAKFAYPYTYDKGNYFKVNDAFSFESSIDELNSYIGTH